jgi:hypothetical protein
MFLVVIYPQYCHALHLQNTICFDPNILEKLNRLHTPKSLDVNCSAKFTCCKKFS